MASAATLLVFLATTALFALVPGPAMLYVAARTMAAGRRAGFLAALGVHLGGYAHIAAAAAGLTVLFRAVPPLYLAVKLGGAAYLVWLGVGLLRASPADRPDGPAAAANTGRRAFLQSIAVEVLNPKTALFFVAFLPQFVDPTGSLPLWWQFAVLGTAVGVIFSAVDVVCVVLAALIVDRMSRSSCVQRLVRRTGGAVLVGIGAHLAMQRA